MTQHSPRRLRLLVALLTLTSLTLIVVDYRTDRTSPLSAFRTVAGAVLGPVQSALGGATSPVTETLGDLPDLRGAQQDAERLRRENDALREQLRLAESDRARATQVERLLQLVSMGQYRTVPANVVGAPGPRAFEQTVTIDVGTRDGVDRDMTVLSSSGLVGRVTAAGPFTSTVLLLSDPNFRVGARLEGNGKLGFVTGGGEAPLQFELLDTQTRIREGDRLVSFGSQNGRPFVPGVPIGEVTAVQRTVGSLTRLALVRPFADLAALEVVGVVVEAPSRDPRDSVLPPRPAARPTARPAPRPSASPTS